ncbi:hypothetical protein LVJ94_35165 [Pendulispora rubella]|uniref:Tetratricopeptide repeat protein n=2 Tax=Pendulispora rubella TaxID=2741070 RepID=A0ABZ2KWJ2_9BACT
MSDDADAHASAYRKLYDLLHQQVEHFEAGAVQIPYLVRIALDPHVIHGGTALTIIAHLVHGPDAFADGFRLSDGLRTRFGFFELPEPSEEFARYEFWKACCDSADRHVPSLLHAAETGSDDVRRTAPYLLAALRVDRHWILPSLQALFARERVDDVRAVLAFAIGMIAPMHHETEEFLLKVIETDRSHLVRLVSAMVFAWTWQYATDRVLQELLEGLCAASGAAGTEVGGFPPAPGDLRAEYARLPFGDDGLPGDLGHILARVEGRSTFRALYPLFRALKTDGVSLLGIVRGILAIGLRESTDSDTNAYRSRAAKAALFYADSVWQMPQATELVAKRGMPSRRDEFGRSIGLSLASHDEGHRAFHLGVALGRQDRVEQALEQFRKAAALRPHHLLSVLNVLWGLRTLQRNREGLVEAERALTVFAQSVELQYYHAQFLLSAGQAASAYEACSRGFAIQDAAVLYRARACAHVRLERPEQAMGDLRVYLAQNPQNAEDIARDEEFASLRERKDFQLLVNPRSAR